MLVCNLNLALVYKRGMCLMDSSWSTLWLATTLADDLGTLEVNNNLVACYHLD